MDTRLKRPAQSSSCQTTADSTNEPAVNLRSLAYTGETGLSANGGAGLKIEIRNVNFFMAPNRRSLR